MTWSRREVLASLGVASAQAALWACGAGPKRLRSDGKAVHPELRTWLRDAVETLHGAGLAGVHVLAVSRQRTTAALDVLGAGVARSRCDGLVIAVRERDGMLREQVSNDLSRDGIATAAKILAGKAKAARVDIGKPPAPFPKQAPDPEVLTDAEILAKVGALALRDRDQLSSRIVYSAAVMDIDDARVWSVAAGRDVQQRLVRVRKSVTRVAWNGTRPIVSEAARAWTGGMDDQQLDEAELVSAREAALALMTPQAFESGEHAFALAPEVAASLIAVVVQALLTAKREMKPTSTQFVLVDDPTVPNAYGGFRFDDAGEPATAVTLIDRGNVVGAVQRARRPGHVGRAEPMASHLRLAAGGTDSDQLLDRGFLLEGPLSVMVDPASDRLVLGAARAREWLSGKRTGRMFADVEVVGELSKILASIDAVSKQSKTIGIRDEIEGQPCWRSIEAPWLRGRGMLRARRRRA